jgi:hypothetical protein
MEMLNGKWLIGGIAALMFAASAAEVSAQGPGGGRGGKPSFDRLLDAFDVDDSESLSEVEVPGRVWSRLSQADADGDGAVTREEFDGYKPGRGGAGQRGGAPAEIIKAWQNGERPQAPAWVFEARANRAADGFGPPAEVIEAWKNGQGFNLPGPPSRR